MTTVLPTDINRGERSADAQASAILAERLPAGKLLLIYQQSAIAKLRASTGLIVIEKSRRIGFTWGIASYAALVAAAAVQAGGDDVFYMGYEQDMAREFIDDCATFAKAYGLAASRVGETVFEDVAEDGSSRGIKAFRIDFGSGFKIMALSSVPRAFRGKQGVVIIDEAAFHSQLEEKLKAAMALLIWGGKVIIVSTHDGVMNPFNQLIDEIRGGKKKGVVIRVTFDDALAGGLYERIALIAEVRGIPVLPKDEWIAEIRGFYGENAGEELDVIPKLSGGSLIKLESLLLCQSDDAAKPELYNGGLYYMGRDVARRNDGQIIWGMEQVGDVLWLRDRWEQTGRSFLEQSDAADWMVKNRRMVAYWLDQGGMGEQPVEEAVRRYGASRVQGQFLAGQNRLDLATGLAKRFEELRIRIPSDPVLRADLLAIKKLPTSGGGVRIADDPDGKVHADRFWAGALASRAADLGGGEYDYRAVKPAGAGVPGGGGRQRLKMRPDHSGDDRGAGGGRRSTF